MEKLQNNIIVKNNLKNVMQNGRNKRCAEKILLLQFMDFWEFLGFLNIFISKNQRPQRVLSQLHIIYYNGKEISDKGFNNTTYYSVAFGLIK
jgi:CTP-dependent riboflavin kinase